MKVLVHFRQQQLEGFVEQLIELNELYINKSYQLNNQLIDLIKNIEAFFKQIGDSTNESKIAQLTLYFHTALDGIDPIQLVKLKIGKRNLINTAAFHCLNELHNLIQTELEKVNQVLKEGEEPIAQVILTAMQNNLIDENNLEESNNLETEKQVWTNLLSNQQIKMLNKKLRLTILSQDIYLLINKIFHQLKKE